MSVLYELPWMPNSWIGVYADTEKKGKGKKNETLIGDNIIYFFVSLNELDIPEYHIVPSKIVADTIKAEHSIWLNTLGKKGQKHKENPIRKFQDKEDKYKDNWSVFE